VPREADVIVGVTSRAGDDGALARELAAADGRGRLQRVVRLEPVKACRPGDLPG